MIVIIRQDYSQFAVVWLYKNKFIDSLFILFGCSVSLTMDSLFILFGCSVESYMLLWFVQQGDAILMVIRSFFLGEETFPSEVTVCIPNEWMPCLCSVGISTGKPIRSLHKQNKC